MSVSAAIDVSVGKAVVKPMMRSLNDAPVNMRGLREVISKQGRRQKKNKDDTEENDRYDGPDGSNQGGDGRRPDDGGSGTTPPPDAPKPGEGGSGPNGEKQRGVDRGDGRDDYGHFVSTDKDRPYVDKEQLGLDQVASDYGVDIHRDQVRATVDGSPKGRYYDGLFENADGTFSGVEIKSGNAQRSASQNLFDSLVSVDNPATAMLGDKPISIVNVILERVP